MLDHDPTARPLAEIEAMQVALLADLLRLMGSPGAAEAVADLVSDRIEPVVGDDDPYALLRVC